MKRHTVELLILLKQYLEVMVGEQIVKMTCLGFVVCLKTNRLVTIMSEI